jgi:hypothetical protein
VILSIDHKYHNFTNRYDCHGNKVFEISNREMKHFENINATKTLSEEENQQMVNKINEQLVKTIEVITNQSKTIENLKREMQVLRFTGFEETLTRPKS